ncbi:TPA: HAD-IIIA family hydrolase [bacterium]|nr:HAD-IIIA family hydrolase [bacterium]
MKPKAILLDFYGTVVEEDWTPLIAPCESAIKASSKSIIHDDLRRQWDKAFRELCFNSYGENFKYEKDLGVESLQMAVNHFDADLDCNPFSQDLIKYWDEYWGNPPLFPESVSVLDTLKELNLPVCIVSNIDNDVLDSALKYNDLQFDLIVTSEDCRSYKPRPEMFEKALSLLNLKPNQVLHVGDSLFSDVKGAKNMGITALWINRKMRPISTEYEKPDYISEDLTGIIDILMK